MPLPPCRSVYLEQQREPAGSFSEAVRQDPQLPQGFYPVEPRDVIRPGDRLRVTCDFNSSGEVRQGLPLCCEGSMVYGKHGVNRVGGWGPPLGWPRSLAVWVEWRHAKQAATAEIDGLGAPLLKGRSRSEGEQRA